LATATFPWQPADAERAALVTAAAAAGWKNSDNSGECD